MTHPSPTGPSQPNPPPSPRDRRPVGTLAQYRLPGLGDIISDARNDGMRMLATLRRNYDPGSAPDGEAYPGLTDVDVLLSRATSHLREALRELASLSALGLPPGSAILFSARQDACTANSALGGPLQSRRSPGYAASDTASESVGSAIPATATSSPVHVPGEKAARPASPSPTPPATAEASGIASPEAGASSDSCSCPWCAPRRSSWANAPARPLGAPPT
jgi:hypothetical protein